MTRLVRVGLDELDHPALAQAAGIICRGDLVVFPTETVYGLGALATDHLAATAVFDAKHRPPNTPLPIQIADLSMLEQVAVDVPAEAYRLAEVFWPGPLTIVMPRHPSLSDIITAGGSTVGIRIPDHPLALRLLQLVNAPVIATSANISGSPAAVTAQEAFEQLSGLVELIIDSGPCAISTASTVVGWHDSELKVLRQGSITLEEINHALERSSLRDRS